jgi:hypothetical protein
MASSDHALRQFVATIVADNQREFTRLLDASPELAMASFQSGATREDPSPYYLDAIGRYIVAGDTALHIAAAAYRTKMARLLIDAGANVHAVDRHGEQPIHAAAVGIPGSRMWNPSAQAATLFCLVQAGADPNSADKRGVAPLHRAVRTRCAEAVRVLLECGADPALANANGSTPMLLATENTGRGGAGSQEAKEQQQEIARLLRQALGTA